MNPEIQRWIAEQIVRDLGDGWELIADEFDRLGARRRGVHVYLSGDDEDSRLFGSETFFANVASGVGGAVVTGRGTTPRKALAGLREAVCEALARLETIRDGLPGDW